MLATLFDRQRIRTTLGVLLAALALRLAFFALVLILNPDGFFETDSRGYWQIAQNLVERGTFSASVSPPLVPDHTRTPVYPLFLAALRSIGLSAALIVVVQIVLSLFAVLFAMQITERLFGNGTPPAWAGLLLAIDVPSISIASSLLTETLFTALFLLGALLAVEYFLRRRPLQLVLGAVVLGLAVLCRPVAVFFPAVLLVVHLAVSRARWRSRIGAAALYLAVFLLTLSPWVVRNYLIFGRPFLSTIGDVNMLEYRAAAVYAEKHG
ncbi:MAG: glycosyltransferase family 39 protein, partial [Acidobacteriota bacterium]